MRSIWGKAFILFFVLALAMPLMCQAMRRDVFVPEIYQIDYNGPQMHAVPPRGSADSTGSLPNRAGVKSNEKRKKRIHA